MADSDLLTFQGGLGVELEPGTNIVCGVKPGADPSTIRELKAEEDTDWHTAVCLPASPDTGTGARSFTLGSLATPLVGEGKVGVWANDTAAFTIVSRADLGNRTIESMQWATFDSDKPLGSAGTVPTAESTGIASGSDNWIGYGMTVVSAASEGQSAAMKANDFLNTLGVTTHHTQGRDTAAQVQSGLQFLGVRHFRDDGTVDQRKLTDYCNIHTATGATMSMLPWGGDLKDTQTFLDTLASCGGLLDVEGPNEPNNFPFVYKGVACNHSSTFLGCAQFQRDLYATAKADPKLASLPVFTLTEPGTEPDNAGLQFITIPSGSGTLMPDGTVFADYANLHNYVKCNGCSGPRDNIAWNAEAPGASEGAYDGLDGEFLNRTFGRHFPASPIGTNLPRVTTETGWDTNGGVTQDQQGKILVNVYLSAAARGWTYTFIYQMIDDSDSFGVFQNTNPLTPKLAANYIHNLTSILADTSSNFSAQQLAYTISNEPATVHDLLLQKSNGTYELIVWGDQVPPKSANVIVNLGSSHPTVKVYDITSGTTPVQSLSNANSVPLTLADHALIVEFRSGPLGRTQ